MDYYYFVIIGLASVLILNLIALGINRKNVKEFKIWQESHNKEARDFDELMKKTKQKENN